MTINVLINLNSNKNIYLKIKIIVALFFNIQNH